MEISAFDFDLPAERIALRPARPRDAARLLVVRPGAPLADHVLRDLPDLLAPGDLLVVNDSRVRRAQLRGLREARGGTARIDLTLHRQSGPQLWQALARPAKRLRVGDVVRFAEGLEAEVVARGEGGEVVLRFDRAGAELADALERVGEMPLPPYIARRRAADAQDTEDYQTVFARHQGSVAAPTAGLHFTPRLLDALAARGIQLARVTLHVGPGTFLPVTAARVEEHRIHAEWGEVGAEAAAAISAAHRSGRRVVAVGTTALRLIETAAAQTGAVAPFRGETALFITPGHRFRAADALLTNFHLPRSSLFMLVCAFSGIETMRAAYAHATATGYRFYSYGDASLLFPQRERG